ncbi:NAD(+) synthase [Myxococcota bacterium]
MKLIRVAAAALNQTPLAWDENKANIGRALFQARSVGAHLVCLPELCITGYGCEDAFLSPGVQTKAIEILAELLPATRGLLVSLGLPLVVNGAVFNTCCLVDDGRVLGFVAKQVLAGDGVHYEPRWFKAWPRNRRCSVRLWGEPYPLGDLWFDCGGVRISFEICEDAWSTARPGARSNRHAVDVILNPSASHFAFGKQEVRKRLVLEGSRAFGVSYLYANLLGNEAGRVLYDGDTLIASDGEILAAGRRFSFADHQLITATIDVDLTRTRRSWRWGFRPVLGRASLACVTADHSYPAIQLAPPSPAEPTQGWENSDPLKEEEFARAISLGLFDYMRKTRARGFVVSMSGGADSSAVAALASLGLSLAVNELGMAGVKQRLAYLPELADASAPEALVRHLVLGVYQATRNSSALTRRAARQVAEALGASYMELELDRQVDGYVELIETAIGRRLNWDTDDVSLQNIQARARSPSAWMLANLRGSLLLATSNRSEAAVGYATMDGDTSGGLCPIGGIDKAYLRRWLVWLERVGPAGLGPLPVLGSVTSQVPSAELRPHGSYQTDEDDLMPYDLLDAIERGAIRDKRSPIEVLSSVRLEYPQYSVAQLGAWVERFFVLFAKNQWKRERYAPSFHVDDANLDPKTWCRWPILSGGFKRELEDLRAFLRSLPGCGLGPQCKG